MYHRNETTRNILNRTSAPEMYVEEKKALKCSQKLSARFLFLVHDAKKKKKQASKRSISSSLSNLPDYSNFVIITAQ